MLAQATKRVQTELRDQPDIADEMYFVLGTIYQNLDLPQYAAPLLEELLSRQRASGAAPTYASARADDGLLGGAVGIPTDVLEEGESLGYWIRRPHWCIGFATWSARAMRSLPQAAPSTTAKRLSSSEQPAPFHRC